MNATGQRSVGVVLNVYAGRGAFTRVRVAYDCTVEDFYNVGWNMTRLLAPQPGKVIAFFPETKNGQFYKRGLPVEVIQGNHLDF